MIFIKKCCAPLSTGTSTDYKAEEDPGYLLDDKHNRIYC